MEIQTFFDDGTSTLTYVIWDQKTCDAVIVDSVLNYDPASSKYWSKSVDDLMGFVEDKNLCVHLVLETHVHADHLTGAQELKRRIPSLKVAIGEHISKVQSAFKAIFNFGDEFKTDGRQFDLLLKDKCSYEAGSLKFTVYHTPGHTPACCSYLFGDALFTGDALFMPDSGVARCDFPGGSAEELYHSVHEVIYGLPDSVRVFTGHDYQPGGRNLKFETTIRESKQSNVHLSENTSLEDFVKLRTDRDKTLSAPRLLLPSVQVNAMAGLLPEAESNGIRYLKLPLVPRD